MNTNTWLPSFENSKRWSWFEENRILFFVGGGALIFFFLGWIVFSLGREYRNTQALHELRSSLIALQNGKLDDSSVKNLLLYNQGQHDSDYLFQMLLLFKGRTYEEKKDLLAARKAYEEAVNITGPFTGESLLALARTAEAAGDSLTAFSARERFLALQPNSPQAELVRMKIGKE